MSHSLTVKAAESREPGRPDTACLIFTPPSRQSRSPTKRGRKPWHAAWTGCSVNLPLGWRNRFSRTKRRISCTSCTKRNLIMSTWARRGEISHGPVAFLFCPLKGSDRYLGADWVVTLQCYSLLLQRWASGSRLGNDMQIDPYLNCHLRTWGLVIH